MQCEQMLMFMLHIITIKVQVSFCKLYATFFSKQPFDQMMSKKFQAALVVLLSSLGHSVLPQGSADALSHPAITQRVPSFSDLFTLTRPLALQLQEQILLDAVSSDQLTIHVDRISDSLLGSVLEFVLRLALRPPIVLYRRYLSRIKVFDP